MQSTTLTGLLDWHSTQQADKVAYVYLADGEREDGQLTYAELASGAKAVAQQLLTVCQPGDRALLLYHSGLDFLTAFFGCLYAGVVAVPAYPPRKNNSLNRVEAISADATAAIALTTSVIKRGLERDFELNTTLQGVPLVATDQLPTTESGSITLPAITPGTLAFLQYTSGSTGTPKGVMITHDNLYHNLLGLDERLSHSATSCMVTWLPIFHDMGLIYTILMPLYKGFRCYIMAPAAFIAKPLRWLRAMSTYRATHSAAPNFAFDLCAAKASEQGQSLADIDLSTVEAIINGAEPVRSSTIDKFLATYGPVGFRAEAICPGYGLAENTVAASLKYAQEAVCEVDLDATAFELHIARPTTPGHKNIRQVSCGQPADGTGVAIVRPETQVRCAADEIGEIWLAGPSVAKGYWQNPAATEAVFGAYIHQTTDGPYLRTGDLGFLRDGELFITGRLKDMLVIRGLNHYPQDIELTAETSHDALRKGVCVAFTITADDDERLVIVGELNRHVLQDVPEQAIYDQIREAVGLEHGLDVYDIVLLRTMTMPKTSSGKLQRQLCKQQYQQGGLSVVASSRRTAPIDFSLLYFSSHEAAHSQDKYRLVLEGAKFADAHDFRAVWLPERHFHAFGGLYPDPCVLASALAVLTRRLRLCAGSIVLPLNDPIRVAESWSVVDNLSGGRVDLAFARGWNPNDFVLSPGTFAENRDVLFSRLDTVKSLWRGESVKRPNGHGDTVPISIFPLPQQPELPVWITCSGGEDMFVKAGEIGANVLTALLFQSPDELGKKIAAYRQARAKHGHDPATGQVTLMLHAFVNPDPAYVRQQVKEPFMHYLRSSVDLWQHEVKDIGRLNEAEREAMLAYAFERYFSTTALFGTPESCLTLIEQVRQVGVNEVAALIDFGIDSAVVLDNLIHLDTLRKRTNGLSTQAANSPTQVRVRPSAMPVESPRHRLRSTVTSCVADALDIQPNQVPTQRSFYSIGVNSIRAVSIISTLNQTLGTDLSPSVLFEASTVDKLTDYLLTHYGSTLAEQSKPTAIPVP